MAQPIKAWRSEDGTIHASKREAVEADKQMRASEREDAARIKRLEALDGIEGEVFELMRRVRAETGMTMIRDYFKLVGADDVEHLLTMKDKLPDAKSWAENTLAVAFDGDLDGDDI